jgi:Acetyltransferase (GNAT) domain
LKIEPINIDSYTLFFNKYSHLFSVFSHPDWLKIYDKQCLLFGIFNENNDIIGSFFLYQENRKGITYLTNPPYTPHIGLTYINPAEKLHQQYTFTKKIQEGIANYIDAHCKTFTYIALAPEIIDSQTFTWHQFNVVPNYTYQMDLSQTEQQLLENMSSKKRNSYKKAIKDGIFTKRITDFTILKTLISNTFSRKKKKIDSNLIDTILFQFANEDNSFCFCSYENETPIAASFCIFYNQKCYYLLSGYNHLNKHQGAGIMAVYNAMCWAKKNNIRIFDFEGSMLPEVEDYFREFGGELIPYNTINKAYGIYKKPMRLFKGNQF